MKNEFKIAIFSGAIPSSTFIERLIDGISAHHQVFLYGVIEGPYHYTSKNVKIYITPRSHIRNLFYTMYRSCLLLVKAPKDLFNLFSEIKRYSKLYDKWIWFSKFLPVILYRPDVFHMQWVRDLEFYTFLKTRFNIDLLVSLRGAHINYTPIVEPHIGLLYKRTFPHVKAFHAVSHTIGQEALQFGNIKDRTKVIYSPLPKDIFERYTIFKKNKNSCIKICWVGRFHWVKGVRYAIDACKRLQRLGHNIELHIISTNAPNEETLIQIHQLNLKQNVKISMQLTPEEVFAEMKASNLLLLTSLAEGIANVVLEAMALGVPVVSTNAGGMHEVVRHGETGWLVPVRNTEAIANAIIDLNETSEEELQKITQNAHNFVKAHFNAELSINKFMELYKNI